MNKLPKDNLNSNYYNNNLTKSQTGMPNLNHFQNTLFKAGNDIMTSQSFSSITTKKRDSSLSKTYNCSLKPIPRCNRSLIPKDIRSSTKELLLKEERSSNSKDQDRELDRDRSTHNFIFKKFPSLQTPDVKEISKLATDYFKNKQAINLEDLLIQEEKLWYILINIRFGIDFNIPAEEYLEFTHISSIQTFEPFFSEPKFRAILRVNSIYEYTSVILCVLSFLENKLNDTSKEHLKHLLYYTHQNILLVISILLSRMDKNYIDNIWGNKLKEIVYHRRRSDMKDDDPFHLQQNMTIIQNMLQNYIDIYFKNPYDVFLYKFINDVINNNEGMSLGGVRATFSKIKIDLIHDIMTTQALISYSNPNAAVPYLPPIDKSRFSYSLVLDLDETLVHSDPEESRLLVRPGTERFLEELSSAYEVIVFTAAIQDYADSIMNAIDKERKWIQYRLYRQHTTLTNNTNIKDIAKLGRDLSKTIIIDNISDNFQKQSDNGIFIKTWIGDKSDTALIDLIPLLKEITETKVKDVRKALRKVRDILIRLYVQGDEHPFDTLKNSLSGKEGK